MARSRNRLVNSALDASQLQTAKCVEEKVTVSQMVRHRSCVGRAAAP